MSLVGTSRRMGDLLVGSWVRTGVVALVALLIFAVAAWAGATGRLAGLRYADIPWIHPYPPAGFYVNPLNPTGDRGDLIDAANANRVKADLLMDGELELKALQANDISLLGQADTGNSLATIRSLLLQNQAAGLTEDFQNNLTSIRVGKLTDPNDASVTWCVEEIGTSRITLTKATSGEVVRQSSIRFDDKFWMVIVGGRYLITDVEAHSQPVSQ